MKQLTFSFGISFSFQKTGIVLDKETNELVQIRNLNSGFDPFNKAKLITFFRFILHFLVTPILLDFFLCMCGQNFDFFCIKCMYNWSMDRRKNQWMDVAYKVRVIEKRMHFVVLVEQANVIITWAIIGTILRLLQ